MGCSFDKVVKHHGVHFLENKQKKLIISETNKNDTTKSVSADGINGLGAGLSVGKSF